MKRRNKYGVASKAARTCNGITYASKAEMLYHAHLRTMASGGLIREIETQPVVKFASDIKYVPDFKVTLFFGPVEWIDVKGVETPEFKLKCKLWKHEGPGDLKIVKLKGSRFVTDRVIKGGGNGKA